MGTDTPDGLPLEVFRRGFLDNLLRETEWCLTHRASSIGDEKRYGLRRAMQTAKVVKNTHAILTDNAVKTIKDSYATNAAYAVADRN